MGFGVQGPLIALSLIAILALAGPLAGTSRPSAPAGAVLALGRYDVLRDGIATDVGDIVTPVILWSFQTNGTAATSPLAADVDGDGRTEVFFGEFRPTDAADGSRRGYVLDDGGHLEYAVPMRHDAFAAAAADLDGDGTVEILFTEGSHGDVSGEIGFRAFRGRDGAPLWSATTEYFGGEGFFASPALTDVDGDGALDLIAGSMDHTVYAIRGLDGRILWRSGLLEHYVRHSTPMADLDEDGRLEVTVHTEAGVVHTFDAISGTEEWSRDLGDVVAATPAVGDLDGDGRLEVVYSLALGGGVAALHGDGSPMWQNPTHDYGYRGATLVDVDGDGRLDVIEGDANDPSVTAYRGLDGAILWTASIAAPWASGPIASGDVDGDGLTDVLAGSDAGLLLLDAGTGATKWSLPLPAIRGEPLLKDIDGDGTAEIFVGAGDGRLYAIGSPADLRFEPRTHGYWKHQCTIDTPRGDHLGIQQTYIDEIRSRSDVFRSVSTRAEVCRILEGPRRDDLRGRAELQLMALWLNVVSGLVNEQVPIDLAIATAKTVGAALLEVEAILTASPPATRAELERAKEISDLLNNGRR